ncbi:MAG: RNA polymerase subunit sigma-24, partial [Planctomycetota bacterium]
MSAAVTPTTAVTAPRRFATTRWSVVLAAGGVGSDARRALGELCDGAWYPLYAYARHTGLLHDDAADAVQGFFAELLAR